MAFNYLSKEADNSIVKGKIDRKGLNKKGVIALSLVAMLMVGTLTGCGNSETKNPETTEQTSQGVMLTAEEYAQFQSMLAQQNQDTNLNIGEDDTYFQADWDKFVTEAFKGISRSINNTNENNFEIALSIWNLNYLSDSGKQVLLNLYSDGRDIESLLNTEYSLASQIREHNTELKSSDDYYYLSNLALNESDKAILAALDEYSLEVNVLSKDLSKANKTRIKEIFDMILAFSNGTGTIEVSYGGEIRNIAQIHLTDGGIFAAEIIAQQISVMSKDIVSQKDRETLDAELRNKDNLANVTNMLVKYTTLATIDGISIEEQAKVVSFYEQTLEVIAKELAEMGVSGEEAQALLVVYNIDYFMNSLESQGAFSVIYKDGFDINSTFKLAEEAISKIVLHNDKQKSVDDIYDMARLSMNNIEDAISLRALSGTAYNVTSTNEEVSKSSAMIIKGYSQYSSEVTIDYQTRDEEDNLVDHSLDKNALSKGGQMVSNWYTYYSMMNHKSIYSKYMDFDAVIKYVDGTSRGLNPYQSIVFMVEDYCAENNVAVYDYEMGNNK